MEPNGRKFTQFTDMQKGAFYLLGGIFLLLYALNIIGNAFNIVVILVAVAIIIYGLVLAEIPQQVIGFVKRLQNKK